MRSEWRSRYDSIRGGLWSDIRTGSVTPLSQDTAQMRRRTYIALGLVVLFSVVIFWLNGRTSPRFVGGFSAEDFKEVQKVIRHTMWRRAFPGFSAKTFTAAPGSLWRLTISRIQRVYVYAGGTWCEVVVWTPLGIDLFEMQKSAPKPGQTNWRITSEMGSAGAALIKKIEGYGGAKLPVKGGFGLLGGKLPAVFYTPAVYREHFFGDTSPTSGQALGLASNQVSLSFEARSVLLDDDSRSRKSRHDSIAPGEQFSGWLSNHNELQLRPDSQILQFR